VRAVDPAVASAYAVGIMPVIAQKFCWIENTSMSRLQEEHHSMCIIRVKAQFRDYAAIFLVSFVHVQQPALV
jgi:hypothetical protein